jgi:hypothetical protein
VNVAPWIITLPELAGRIRATVATVALDLLSNMWIETDYRYDIYWAIHSPFIEHL